MLPKLFSIGGFFQSAYGVLVSLAFLVALWMAARLARRSNLNSDSVVNLGIYCALAGVVGAKLMMFVFDFDYYLKNPGEILSFSTLRAGGVFQGGLLLAIVTAFWYIRKEKLPGLLTADVFAPGIALGHAIGRIGCFCAGCCWGIECHKPWAVTFTNPEANQMVGVPLGIPLHPTQLYEALAEAAIFVFLYWLFQRPHRAGEIIGYYLVLYSLVRFLVEFVRYHEQPNPFHGPFSITQWLALGLLAPGIWLLLRKKAEMVKPALSLAR